MKKHNLHPTVCEQRFTFYLSISNGGHTRNRILVYSKKLFILFKKCKISIIRLSKQLKVYWQQDQCIYAWTI
jgi:hypothetical protein